MQPPSHPHAPLPQPAEIAIRRLLKGAPQDLWLDTIRRATSPAHNTLVYWMLCQPECDFAVAAHAFYRSKPADFLDEPHHLPARPGPYDIFALVLVNWDTGYYRTHRLKIDERDASLRQLAQVNQKVMARVRGSLPFKIPQRFLEPKGGHPARVPLHLSPTETRDIWELYRDAGLDVPADAPGLSRRFRRIKSLMRNSFSFLRRAG